MPFHPAKLPNRIETGNSLPIWQNVFSGKFKKKKMFAYIRNIKELRTEKWEAFRPRSTKSSRNCWQDFNKSIVSGEKRQNFWKSLPDYFGYRAPCGIECYLGLLVQGSRYTEIERGRERLHYIAFNTLSTIWDNKHLPQKKKERKKNGKERRNLHVSFTPKDSDIHTFISHNSEVRGKLLYIQRLKTYSTSFIRHLSALAVQQWRKKRLS